MKLRVCGFAQIVIKLQILRCCFAEDGTELFWSPCHTCSTLIFPHSWPINHPILNAKGSLGSLSKDDVDWRENVIWKCNFAFLQSFLNYSVIMPEKCFLTILELNWNQRLGHNKTELNICHHMLTSSTQLQNKSFHVVERTRTSSKCQKMKNARAKRAKILFFIVKYANLWAFCCRRRRGCLSSLFKLQWQWLLYSEKYREEKNGAKICVL